MTKEHRTKQFTDTGPPVELSTLTEHYIPPQVLNNALDGLAPPCSLLTLGCCLCCSVPVLAIGCPSSACGDAAEYYEYIL